MKNLFLLLAAFASLTIMVGCNTTTDPNSGKPAAGGTDDHEHDHKAPHGGHLIEIGGNHEYHAELVDNHDTESITIYMMDADMKPMSIKEKSVSLVLTQGAKTQTFELPAVSEGSSSEFTSQDAELMKMIDGGDLTGKLRVNIDGKQFTGSFDHHAHDAEHDHD